MRGSYKMSKVELVRWLALVDTAWSAWSVGAQVPNIDSAKGQIIRHLRMGDKTEKTLQFRRLFPNFSARAFSDCRSRVRAGCLMIGLDVEAKRTQAEKTLASLSKRNKRAPLLRALFWRKNDVVASAIRAWIHFAVSLIFVDDKCTKADADGKADTWIVTHVLPALADVEDNGERIIELFTKFFMKDTPKAKRKEREEYMSRRLAEIMLELSQEPEEVDPIAIEGTVSTAQDSLPVS